MPSVHFRRSPSASSRWMNCPGSLALSDGIPNKSSPYAEEGTAAHALAERLLKEAGKMCVRDVDQAMYDAVKVYIDEIESWRQSRKVVVEHTERTVQCLTIDGLGGTCDHFMVYVERGDLVGHIFDYKHGQGVPVSVTENKQVLSYGVILDSVYPRMLDRWRGTIVQPRCFQGDAIQTWEFGPERVAQHAQDILATIGRDDLRVGEWCRWCPALSICPEQYKQAVAIAQSEFSEVRHDAQRLLELMEMAPGIEAFMKQVPAALLEMFRQGQEVPGHKVIECKSHRRWNCKDDAVVAKALKEIGIEPVVIKQEVKSPAQVDKEIDGLKDKEAKKASRKKLSEMCSTVVIGHKVVPLSHRGQAVDVTNGFSEFDDLELLQDA